jgi:putative FmdB family regulatory protein
VAFFLKILFIKKSSIAMQMNVYEKFLGVKMPVYEYKCSKCGKVFEHKQSINDKPLTKCLESVCEEEIKGQGEVSRIISSNVGLVFKGSGFYLTDYARAKNGTSAANGKSETKQNETKPSDKQSESKNTEAKKDKASV